MIKLIRPKNRYTEASQTSVNEESFAFEIRKSWWPLIPLFHNEWVVYAEREGDTLTLDDEDLLEWIDSSSSGLVTGLALTYTVGWGDNTSFISTMVNLRFHKKSDALLFKMRFHGHGKLMTYKEFKKQAKS